MKPRRHVLGVTLLAASIAGCTSSSVAVIPGGNADRGARTIAEMGCGACHHIPGVPGANGMVGPPLDNVAQRGMLAGELPNSPENMVHWIRSPDSVEPATAMPDLHIGEQSARDIVAYLYSLH